MADLNTGMRNMASEWSKAEQRQHDMAPGTSSDSGKAQAGTSKAEVREDDTAHNIPGAFPGDGDESAANSTQNTVPGGFPDEYGISEGSQPQTSTAEHQATAASKGPMTNAATSLGHGPTGHPVVSGINDKDLAKGQHATNPDGGPRNPTDRAPPSTNPPALSELGGLDSDSSHPTPPKQSEVGDSSNIGPHGLQQRTPRQADGKPAPGSKGVGQEAVSIEESPAKTQDQSTAKPGELAEQVARGVATVAVAGGLAAKDAALWAKDKAVETYPAARDKTVENATWAKDRAAENYPAVKDTTVENATWAKDRAAENYPAARDQTINAATSTGNAAYSGAATAASAISSTTQSAIQAATEALPGAVKNRLWTGTSAEAPKPEPAAGVPKTVQDSLSRAGESPEAAANPEAVGDKHKLESELLNIAGSVHKDEDKKAEGAPDKMVEGASDKKTESIGSNKTDAPPHAGAGTIAGVGALAGHMPNRTESTDFVKIISTETYKPQAGRAADDYAHKGEAGPGAAAQEASPAHGGGPAPKNAGSVAGGSSAGGGQFQTVLGSDGMQKHSSEGLRGDTEYTFGQDELKDARNDTHPKGEAVPGTAVETGLGGGSGLPTSLQAAQRGDNIPRSLQGAAAAGAPSAAAPQAAWPGSDAPRSYGQSQQQERAEPVRKTVGDDGVKEVDYNKLSSGTPSGVAGTHYSSK